jgi:hypothetical protein
MADRAVPNLYLKWRAVRELVGLNRSDAAIADTYFGAGEGPIKFSKLLRGDYGCANDIADYLAGVINEAIDSRRKRAGLKSASPVTVRGTDLWAPLYEFIRKLLEAVEHVEDEALDRAHEALLQEMRLPSARLDQGSRLRVERYAKDRMFAGFEPSGGSGPVVFKPDRHLGRLVVEGLTRSPTAAYVFITRDTASLAKHLWDMNWGETVMWLPSPFAPSSHGKDYLLMAEPQPVSNVPGRFTVTAAMLYNPDLAEALDPRRAPHQPRPLDEAETARFVTNLRRITDPRQKSKYTRDDLSVVSVVYVVEA